MKHKLLAALFAVIACFCLTFGLAACGGQGGEEHTHTYGEWTITAPTDTAAGIAERSCTANDDTQTVTLPALSDSGYTITNDTANETEAGTGTYTITIGGETFTFTAATPAKGTSSSTVEVTSITLSQTTAELTVDETLTLTATVSPEDATDKTVTWVSDNTSVATVENGVVTGIAAGTATITATAGGYSATCVVTVNNKTVAVTGITLDKTTAEITVDETLTLTATASPEDATDKTVNWASDNTSVATVENGVVTGIAAGTATITATAGGYSATCTITVTSAGETHTEHTYGEWEATLYPTEISTGTATRECSECGDKQTVTLPALTDSGYTKTNDGELVKYTITVEYDGTNYQISFSTEGEKVTYTVTFISGGSTISTQTITEGETAQSVTPDSQTGKYFTGWYTDSNYTTAFDFDTAITSDITLYAKWVELDASVSYMYGGYESIAIEWGDTNAAGAQVTYKLSSSSDSYVAIDSNLIRAASTTDTLRADIVGLLGGEKYDVRIQTSGNEIINLYDISVTAYDRSGYAHYNYTDGVGAYEDDGSLKDGALVIYLTEDNKNDVSEFCYVYDAATMTYTKEDITQYLYCSVQSNIDLYGSRAQVGIGEILNNRRYSGTDRYNVGIAKLCAVYGAVAIRVIGTVTADLSDDGLTATITGLTDYDATTNGGSVGDNGRMARMTNAKNLTIEGIGEDASIYGWGLHFIASDTLNQYEGAGKGFEVRNITFEAYPEDAIGMEGVQGSKIDETGSVTSGASSADSDLLSSVERCWIHNNSFLPGYCANPAESDKKEGDGSCDFKRGQYYTLSYNYFEYCHKTNLIGSSDTSLQYNISMHHNYWYNCGSRIPLVRRANVHFYNNYIYGDSTDSSASLSYVTSARANSYVFSEANYYDGTKNPVRVVSGGAVKEYNNVYYAATGDNLGTTVSSRTESVSNSCEFIYYNIDYSSFDTNSSLFYYDETTQTSDCYLTDAVTARLEVMQTAGVQKRNTETVDTNMSSYSDKVTSSVDMNGAGELTVDLTQATAGGYVSNVYFTAKYASSSGGVKGKGQIITFSLAYEMTVTVTVSGTDEANLGELVSSNGAVYGSKFTSVTVNLPAGTYFIGAGDKAKEVCVTSLIFKECASDEDKINNAISLIDAIGTVTLSSGDAITSARTAYDGLSSELQAQVTNYSTLTAAESTYSQMQINNVITLIDAIGTVGESSGTAITAARAAYGALTASQQTQVTNYGALTAAETAYEAIAVSATISAIEALADVSTLTTEADLLAAQQAYEAAQELYNALDETQQSEVTNYSKLTQGLADIEQALKLYEFIEAVDELPATITTSDVSAMSAAVTLYNSLTETQIAELTNSYSSVLAAYDAAYEQYTELMSQTTVAIFTKDDPSLATDAGFIVSGNYKSGVSFTYDGTTYNSPLKLESKTSITFTTTNSSNLTIGIYVAGGQLYVDDTLYIDEDGDGIITVTNLAAGSHSISKGDGDPNLCYVIIEPA